MATHRLDASAETVHWGYFDAKLAPQLTIDSGDTVTISTGSSGDGTLRLDLSSTTPSITDTAGNTLTATYSSGTVLTVDKTAPTTNFTTPDESTTTYQTSLTYSVAWTEDGTGTAIATRSQRDEPSRQPSSRSADGSGVVRAREDIGCIVGVTPLYVNPS